MGDLLAALQNERVQVCGFITGEELGAKLLVVEEIDINPHKP
jgi:hypothetical protein